MAKSLCIEQWHEDICTEEGFSFFTAEVIDNSLETIFIVEPVSEKTDPDLYISLEDFPDRSTNYSDNFLWKSTLFGADSISLLPSDSNYHPGIYKISIYNSNPGKYRLRYYSLKLPKFITSPYSIPSPCEDYIKLKIFSPGSSRIQITYLEGQGAIFTSFSSIRPSESNHLYSKGKFNSTPEYQEVDPFPSLPLSFTSFTSQDQTSPDSSQPCSLCIDSEGHYSTLYITLQTFTPALVSISEVAYQDIIPQSLIPAYSAFKSFFSPLDTNQLSLNSRKSNSLEYNLEFTYGEIEFFSYLKVVELAGVNEGDVIWDLGAGAGKSLLAAGLVYSSNQVIGVEYLPELCSVCQKATSELQNTKIVQGDIRMQDWSDADVIYMSSLCFLDDLLLNIISKSESCKPGTRIISLRELPISSSFRLLHSLRCLMSWGRSSCFIYIKA